MRNVELRRLSTGVLVALVMATAAVGADVLLSPGMSAEIKAKIAYCSNPDLSWWDWTVNNCWFWS